MQSILCNKNIVLGITGGIAAYKIPELARLLVKAGAKVKVVMTNNAQKFITPLTMSAVSSGPVYHDLFAPEVAMEHINLARWADLVLIAPASANCLAGLAMGMAHDLLSSTCLATTAPILVAPAMNQAMWHNLAVQHNLNTLTQRGIIVVGPGSGDQACGDYGLGRMLEPHEIILQLSKVFTPAVLAGINVLITAGPTRELVDPVRFISNHSSGKMGYALAHAASDAGANVSLISGPVSGLYPPSSAKVVFVTSAQEMHNAVFSAVAQCDIFLSVAAVSDYYCPNPAVSKIHKNTNEFILNLLPTVDIISLVANQQRKPFVIGFAAETDNLIGNATKKLMNKGMDVIIANQVGENLGFNSDSNEVTVIWKEKGKLELMHFPAMLKTNLARELIGLLASLNKRI